jgi:hypothetical protein
MANYFAGLDPRTVRDWQPKLWLGFSAENQKCFDRRWADMRALAHAGWFVFVSISPMLGPVTLPPDFLALGNRTWVIVNGECEQINRNECRPMKADWARAVRDQCRAADVPFFMRNMHTGADVPRDLWIRQFPHLSERTRVNTFRSTYTSRSNMQIIIPTRGRTHQQLTLQSLPYELRKQTTLVCPKREATELYRLYKDVEILLQPDPTMTIAQKRKWIIEVFHRYGYDKIIMFDDDLYFATRISENDTALRSIRGEELIPEFERIEEMLSRDVPHVGFGQRLNNNNNKKAPGWETAGRMIYTLAFYLPTVVNECELGRIETREDMDLTLQLLRKGYPNAVWNRTVVDQRQFDAPGGATNERTVESMNADALKLAELHPGYVDVVERDYSTSVPRLEVVCQWKKAFEDGRTNW